MKFLKPLLSLGSAVRKPMAPKPTSFGEKRAQQMNQSLNKAINERKTLLKKEFASPDPLDKIYQHKGYQLDAKIRKLKDES